MFIVHCFERTLSRHGKPSVTLQQYLKLKKPTINSTEKQWHIITSDGKELKSFNSGVRGFFN